MADVADFDLEKEPEVAAPMAPRQPSKTPWVIGAVVLVAVAAAFVLLRRDPSPGDPVGVTATDAPVAEAPQPLGTDVEPIELPPLDQSDALVRELVRMLTSHPRVAAWLTTDGLIRNFAVVVDNVAAGHTPARQLQVLKPPGSFAVVSSGSSAVIDPRGFNRYNDFAAAVASVDAEGAARLYSTLKPRIEEAYRELGYAASFDRALETAIVRLLEVPAADGEIAVVPRGALYAYNDLRLERLTAAQKQLLRMGPRNIRTIQRTLRDVALALGIPAARLPAR